MDISDNLKANTECTLTNPVDQAEHGLTYPAQDGQAENSNVDSVENAKLKLQYEDVLLLRACDMDVVISVRRRTF